MARTRGGEALTREAVRELLAIRRGGDRFTPIGRLVDERVIVNAMVALLATGGSTNHLIHWVAVARAAGILIDWTDFADLAVLDVPEAAPNVAIDMTGAHFWDISGVAALDKIVARLRRDGRTVDVIGYNRASADIVDKFALHDKTGFELGVSPH